MAFEGNFVGVFADFMGWAGDGEFYVGEEIIFPRSFGVLNEFFGVNLFFWGGGGGCRVA